MNSLAPFSALRTAVFTTISLAKWRGIAGAVLLATASANAADLVWIGGTGNWNAAANWSPAQVPTAADNAFITNNGTDTVTVPAGTTATAGSVSVGGASGTQTLSIDRATLTLNNASVVNANGHLDFLVAQSVLTGAGDLTVNGTLNWVNGTISGAGVLSIGGGGLLAIGSGGVTLARTLKNGGTTTWAGGNLTASTGATINNLAGGTFDITADGHLNGSATTPISNLGLIRQTAGTVSTIVTAPFTNSGTLEVRAATLSLNLGGTQTGSISNAPGATLQFGGGSHVLAAGSFVIGAGAVAVSGGATTLTASGTFDVGSTLNVTAGTVTLSGTCNVTGATLSVSGGIVNFNSAGSVAVVNVTGGTLGGTSPVTVTGPLTLSGGTVTNALVNANGGLTINGNTTLNGAKLINPGTAIWSAGNFTGANGAVFSNLLGATFINTFDGNAGTGAGATPIFVNAGLFQKTNGTAPLGTTSIDFQFINTGTVEVRTNTLRYGINQQTAGLTLLDGGNLTAQAQPLQFLGGSLVGIGLVTVANVQNLINSATVSPGLPLGELDVTGNDQQTASGVLNIELGGYSPGTNFDLVTVTAGGAGGVATLGGTLNVTITNGFSPTNGATFTFLTANSRVGAFATFNYPTNDIGMQVSYDLTSAKVTVSNLKPVVANPIVDPAPVTYGATFNFQFPANTFTDPDNDTLSYTATGLPTGITFVGATRTFSGTPTQAGVFPVTVVANDGGSPTLIATNTFTITVNQADITGNFTVADKVYDGNTNATVLTRTLNGVLPADTANVSLTGGTASFGTATVGAGKLVTLTGATLTGTAATNYNLTSVGTTT
ncbi:MAG TPA: putative Ig domain-containing protein, partial [Verrucomicrobiae bacterium]